MKHRFNQSRVPMARPVESPMTGYYACPELRSTNHRTGSSQANALPSRMNNRLHHLDGRVTDLQGQPLKG